MSKYLSFWQIEAPVFTRAPPPEQLFIPHALGQKLERLCLACEQNVSLLAVTGASGIGKSMALRWLAQELSTDTHDVLLTTLVGRQLAAGWLTPRLAAYLGEGRAAAEMSNDQLIRATATRLGDLVDEKRRLVMIIDAAHLVEVPAAFDEIAAFLNLGALAGPCLTFVLAGTESLVEVLAAAPDLAGKLAVNTALAPLSRDEVAAYLTHRLKVAAAEATFDEGAVDLLHEASRGIFGALDVIAENCLVEAFQKNLRRVTPELVRLAAPGLTGSTASSGPTLTVPATNEPAQPRDEIFGRSPVSLSQRPGRDPLLHEALQAAAPPKQPAPKAPRSAVKKGPDAKSSAPVSSSADAAKAAESASIKLSSLFKSGSTGAKPKP